LFLRQGNAFYPVANWKVTGVLFSSFTDVLTTMKKVSLIVMRGTEHCG